MISPFVAGKLREAHRLILEEAERFWVAQPILAEGPAGCTPKSGSPVAPGGTDKGVGKGAEAPRGDPSGPGGEGTLGATPADEFEEVKVEEDQHHEKSERKEEKSKRKRRKHRGGGGPRCGPLEAQITGAYSRRLRLQDKPEAGVSSSRYGGCSFDSGTSRSPSTSSRRI